MNGFDYTILKHPSMKHIRKQVDPVFRREERIREKTEEEQNHENARKPMYKRRTITPALLNECQRLSSLLRRYTMNYSSVIRENEDLKKPYLRIQRGDFNRHPVELVETQFAILMGVLVELNKKGKEDKFNYLRRNLSHALGFGFEDLKKQAISLKYDGSIVVQSETSTDTSVDTEE